MKFTIDIPDEFLKRLEGVDEKYVSAIVLSSLRSSVLATVEDEEDAAKADRVEQHKATIDAELAAVSVKMAKK